MTTPLEDCLALLQALAARSVDVRTEREMRRLHGAIWRFLRGSRQGMKKPLPLTPEEIAWAVSMHEGTTEDDWR